MPFSIALVLAAVPSLLWLWLLLRHDDHEPEPGVLVTLALAVGAASTLGVLWLRGSLEDALAPMSPALDAFIVTALAEEGWKLLAFVPFLFAHELDEPLDGAIYGAAVGLGFATIENALYAQVHGDPWLLLQRAPTATLLHAACSGCLGLCLAEGKLRRFGIGTGAWVALGFTVAIGAHGLYDWFLVGGRPDEPPDARVSLLLVLPAALVLLALKVRWARSRSEHFHPPV